MSSLFRKIHRRLFGRNQAQRDLLAEVQRVVDSAVIGIYPPSLLGPYNPGRLVLDARRYHARCHVQNCPVVAQLDTANEGHAAVALQALGWFDMHAGGWQCKNHGDPRATPVGTPVLHVQEGGDDGR